MKQVNEKPRKFFSFLNDFVFKYIFGQEKNEQLCICLLNALLKKAESEKIVSLEFLNPFNIKERNEQKFSVLDVKARDINGDLFNIEVQVREQEDFVPRTVYYLSHLYYGQLKSGAGYHDLKPATGLIIVDFELFKCSAEMHNIFSFRNHDNSLELAETMVLHYIELRKFNPDKQRKLKTPFEKWLSVMKFGEDYAKMKKMPPELENEEGISMAMKLVTKINADRELRQLMEAREKEATDIALMKGSAFKRGRIVGRAEGKEEGRAEAKAEAAEAKKQLIEKMRARGMTPEQISELSDIPLSEI